MKNCLVFLLLCSHHFLLLAQQRNRITVDSMMKEADTYYQKADYSRAQEKYIEVLKQIKKEQNPTVHLQAEQRISKCLYRFRDRNEALVWLYKALNTSKQYLNNKDEEDIYYQMSIMYVEIGKIDSAEKYSSKAIEIWKSKKDYARLSQAYAIMADLYLNAGKNYPKAEKLIEQAENYADSSQNKRCIAFAAMKRYFLITYTKNNHKAALPYVSKAEQLYKEVNDREGLSYAYSFKATSLAKIGDTAAADYFWKWFYFKDSVFQKEKAENIVKYETLYKIKEKEEESSLLNEKAKNQQLWIISMVITILGLLALMRLLVLRKKQHLTALQLEASENKNEAFENLNKEKTRISRDLHDNVGAQLSFLITNIEWMMSHPESVKEDKEFQKRLKSLSEAGRNAAFTLRETIWAIGHKEFYFEDLADRFKQYALKMIEFNKEIEIVFEENINTPVKFSPVNALNIFRTFQEAFHNALNHSQCSKLIIVFFSKPSICIISIQDNGVGFDVKQIKSGHYGLINMKCRAEELKADFKISSEINKGTIITLTLKLNGQVNYKN